MTMTLWAVICVACFVITFATTRERIRPDPKQSSSLREDFGNLLRNAPWIAMFVLTLAHFIFLAMRGGTMFYYFNYYVDHARLSEFLQRVGLPQATTASPDGGHSILNALGLIVNADRSNVANVGFSLFNIASQFVTVIGVVASAYLAMRFGKRAVAIVGFTLAAVLSAAFILLPKDAVGATYGLELIRALAYAPTIPLIWAMFADVADYAEWKTGRRTTGVIFATILFALKTGLSIGGAIAGWLLSGYGYRANVVQSPEALHGIRLTASVYPAVFLVIVVACLVLYRITRSLDVQIQGELAARRATFAGVAAAALTVSSGQAATQ
jgi:Na+/melibiose symporter-like transporter